MPTGEFSISGGYSTSDGFISEVSVADRNLMGRGQYAKASVTYGQRTRGVDLSFVEPYCSATAWQAVSICLSPEPGFELRVV